VVKTGASGKIAPDYPLQEHCIMPAIANRVAALGTTVFSEINMLAAQYNAVNLGQGRPDYDGPAEAIAAAAESMQSGKANQYPPGMGIAPLREGIAAHIRQFYELELDVDAGIVVTCGAAEGVYSAILSVVNPGDEVILIEPYFDTYLPALEWAGGVPVYVPMRPPAWTFDPAELRAAFTEKTRAIILNTPHNPTGRVFTPEELALIAELCREHDVIVIADEVYEHLVYGAAHHTPIATLPGMLERTLTVSSGAKTFSFTGWKVGWVYGHPDLVTGVWRVHQNVTFALNHPGQFGIARALELGADYYAGLKTMYTAKRDLLLEGLRAAGLKAETPAGAFYIMADFSDVFDGDDVAFTKHLISQIGVACIPPSAFFCDAHKHITHSHVRFSYCKNDSTLEAAVERLAKLRV
jgi:N-succinyldiaminopimelate aminotransferase